MLGQVKPELHQSIVEVGTTVCHTPQDVREQLIELTNSLWHDLPIGVLVFYDNRVGYNTRLHNYFPTGWGEALWGLPWVWVEE